MCFVYLHTAEIFACTLQEQDASAYATATIEPMRWCKPHGYTALVNSLLHDDNVAVSQLASVGLVALGT